MRLFKKLLKRKHSTRNTLLLYEYDITCFACGVNVIKRTNELTKKKRKKINFINRMKYAQHKRFCIC